MANYNFHIRTNAHLRGPEYAKPATSSSSVDDIRNLIIEKSERTSLSFSVKLIGWMTIAGIFLGYFYRHFM